MNKKIIIGIIAAIVVIGGTVGTVLGVQAYNTNKEYEQLANNVNECEKMIQNMNYVYYAEDDTAKQARQRDLDKLKIYKEEIESKDMTDEQKSEFSEYCKTLKKNFEQCATDTKAQFDAVQVSKDSHTDEGYYTDEFNNEWNGYVAQYNDLYGKQEYFNAFQVVLTMQNRINEYVAGKDKEAADKAEAERQQVEASQASDKKSNISSNNKNSNRTSANSDSGNSEGSNPANSSESYEDRIRREYGEEGVANDRAVREFFSYENLQRVAPGGTFSYIGANGERVTQTIPE